MKLCFLPPRSRHSLESGYRRNWEAFFSDVPSSTSDYALVSEPSIADFVIEPYGEDLAHTPIGALRPLARQDIQKVVWAINDRPSGRESGFYCSLRAGLFDPTRHCSISYTVPFNELIEAYPPEDASYDFGFVGSLSASVRARMFEALAPRAAALNAVMVDVSYGRDWVRLFSRQPDEEKRSYAEFMRRTRFILCPRGYGDASVRLFETLQSARVPVILSDAYVLPALRGPTAWQSAALFVRERDFRSIPAVVSEAMPRWREMALSARRIWEENFSNATVVDYIACNLARMGDRIRSGSTNNISRFGAAAAAVTNDELRSIVGRAKAGALAALARL